MLSDIEIANNAKLNNIVDIAKNINLSLDDLELYGNFKAKISNKTLKNIRNNKTGKLILVTATSPTPMGEGKTTTTIGLGQAFKKLNKKVIITLREPSLGPCMGVKGGATGGGFSQVVPMDEINLHFTGDIHAITAANNLISSLIDNHIFHGNTLNFDLNNITWNRCVDLNDRSLRNIVIGLNNNGIVREDRFVITVASEIMAILCLAEDADDLKEKLAQIIVGYNKDEKPIFLNDLEAVGAVAALLKDAIKPNLVQSLEGVPTIIHGGPFANIAHGCNSVIATKTALHLSDYVITEAGFGADLGAEKFFDIKCRKANIQPHCAVIVTTCRSLKFNGSLVKDELCKTNLEAIKLGIINLERHIKNIRKYNVPVVVAINRFDFDSEQELQYIQDFCKNLGVKAVINDAWAKGGEGSLDLANAVINLINNNDLDFKLLYDIKSTVKEKINTIAQEIYGAGEVVFSAKANKKIKKIHELNLSNLPICIAKTQYSFSDNPKLLGAPVNFKFNISDIELSNGAGFIVAIAGDIMLMPGLPKKPAATELDIINNGEEIIGLF